MPKPPAELVPTSKPHSRQEPQAVLVREGLPPVVTCGSEHRPAKGIYVAEIGGQKYLRRDAWVLCFKGSKVIPEGIWIGAQEHLKQPDQGQPYVEHSILACGIDGYDWLDAFSKGKPIRSYMEKVEHFEGAMRRREEIAALSGTSLAATADLLNRAAALKALESQQKPEPVK